MPRPVLLPPALVAALAAALAVSAAAPIGALPARAQAASPAPASGQEALRSQPLALSLEAARAAANRILEAEQRLDARARFSQFAPDLQAMTSPAMIAETMAKRPKIISWQLLSVQRGASTTTVEAAVTTAGGVQQDVFIVLNGKGQLTGYYLDRTDEAPSRVAADFVGLLSRGHYISARGFLAPSLHREVSAASLQQKWQDLQRLTGNFVRVRRVLEASSNEDSHLVLVYTEFNRLSENLFVILNANNLITGVDFPQDPAGPR